MNLGLKTQCIIVGVHIVVVYRDSEKQKLDTYMQYNSIMLSTFVDAWL